MTSNATQSAHSQAQTQKQPQQLAAWQSTVTSAAVANLESDAASVANAGQIPLANDSMTSPSTTSAMKHHRQHQLLTDNYSSPPLVAPWTRWNVEARLIDALLPTERRQQQERAALVEEKQRFAMRLPQAPTVNMMTLLPTVASPQSNRVSATSPRLQANDAENFLLRERVVALESQLQLYRVRGDKTARRMRHFQNIAVCLERRSNERLANRFWSRWMRRVVSVLSNAVSASKNSQFMFTPISVAHQKHHQNQHNQNQTQNRSNSQASPYERVTADAVREGEKLDERGQSAKTIKSDVENSAVINALQRRVENLVLRCVDQDQVIRTLFVELAVVGQELERRPEFVPPESASMLLMCN